MSKKPSHIPLFPDAYLRDNYRFTLEQHGLCLILLMEAWGRPDCMLPGDDVSLAEIAQIPVAKFRKICGPVLAQWTREGDKLFQKRLRKEWLYVQRKKEVRSAAASARWDANAMQMESKCNANGMHLGGGGGGGGGALTKGEPLVGSSRADGCFDDQPESFTVIPGGRP